MCDTEGRSLRPGSCSKTLYDACMKMEPYWRQIDYIGGDAVVMPTWNGNEEIRRVPKSIPPADDPLFGKGKLLNVGKGTTDFFYLHKKDFWRWKEMANEGGTFHLKNDTSETVYALTRMSLPHWPEWNGYKGNETHADNTRLSVVEVPPNSTVPVHCRIKTILSPGDGGRYDDPAYGQRKTCQAAYLMPFNSTNSPYARACSFGFDCRRDCAYIPDPREAEECARNCIVWDIGIDERINTAWKTGERTTENVPQEHKRLRNATGAVVTVEEAFRVHHRVCAPRSHCKNKQMQRSTGSLLSSENILYTNNELMWDVQNLGDDMCQRSCSRFGERWTTDVSPQGCEDVCVIETEKAHNQAFKPACCSGAFEVATFTLPVTMWWGQEGADKNDWTQKRVEENTALDMFCDRSWKPNSDQCRQPMKEFCMERQTHCEPGAVGNSGVSEKKHMDECSRVHALKEDLVRPGVGYHACNVWKDTFPLDYHSALASQGFEEERATACKMLQDKAYQFVGGKWELVDPQAEKAMDELCTDYMDLYCDLNRDRNLPICSCYTEFDEDYDWNDSSEKSRLAPIFGPDSKMCYKQTCRAHGYKTKSQIATMNKPCPQICTYWFNLTDSEKSMVYGKGIVVECDKNEQNVPPDTQNDEPLYQHHTTGKAVNLTDEGGMVQDVEEVWQSLSTEQAALVGIGGAIIFLILMFALYTFVSLAKRKMTSKK